MRDFTSHRRFGLIGGVTLFVLGPAQMSSAPPITHNINTSHAPMVRLYGPDGLPLRGPHDESTSGNWSGYAVPAGVYTSVTGTWVVPTVTFVSYPSNPSVENTSTWIGISGGSLIQLGTQQQITSNGTTTYVPWYELLPAGQTNLPSQYTISPGDVITAELVCVANCTANNSNTEWSMSMTNSTKAWTWTENFVYESSLAYAEWIEEAPTSNGIQAIPDFGSVQFSGLTVNGGNPNLSLSADGIILNDSAGGNATPCAAVNGNQFIVDYGTTCAGSVSLTDSHDFNGDGYSDIAWRDTAGDLAIWLMKDKQILSGPVLGNVPTSWTIVGQRALSGDGDADLLWRSSTGDLQIWFMNGTQILSTWDFGTIPISWTIVGTGAYHASTGYAELIWRDTAGDLSIWQINGAQILSAPVLGNVPPSWTIAGTGDFSGTGATDILWRGPTGDVAIWFMNGTQIVSASDFINVPTSWTIVGTGDFNGDGKTDILWRDTAGDVAIWLMNGTQIISSAILATVPTSWTIAETGDFSGDGMSDILWRGPSGDVAIWFMNGTQITSSPDFINVPTNWTIEGANAD